jgi:hypothetical protein
MRWVRHVAYMGDRRGTGVWWVNLRERDLFEDLGVDRRIMLKWIFNK